MAHAAPTPGRPMARTTITPDVFSERTHKMARYGIPVVLGLIYGLWAAANRRDGGEITGWNILFGFVTAIAFMVLCIAVAQFAPKLKRELHSLVKSGFAGAAIGFLYSQTGASVLSSAGLGLAVTAGVFMVFFYRYYTHEDGEGNPLPR
ncbi:hypothetical protein Stsp02_62260 [Streptomyces sp. NBRC 14336]|uniref:hypothetical protein n=1 Tax=Streptomyces sp. NBRC 14336 TaxID=3030992 RepID=UPI0024A1CC28|nr:hypothetical protein [Streptomyces sp. NBRC 14336]WBO79244.1 hypothetical protein SBE_002933 [Streptomyces sp. SBE_14.2]GLW50565.1 hypothetical protein Stsp02_62260 [Streptomyces sp. NBRC 14336]